MAEHCLHCAELADLYRQALARVPEWCMEEDGTVSCHVCYRRQDQGHAKGCARALEGTERRPAARTEQQKFVEDTNVAALNLSKELGRAATLSEVLDVVGTKWLAEMDAADAKRSESG